MKNFRFLDWKVYKDSKKLFNKVLFISNSLPKEYRFEISSQLIRSGLSVVLNISEGSGKNSDRELNRFLDISSGSLFEVLAIIDILRDNKFISDDLSKEIMSDIHEISSQIGGLKKKIKSTL